VNARVAVRLMRALDAAGDRPGAIRHAAIHQALVRDELDLPADADVVRLADEIRAGMHGPAPTVATAAPANESPPISAPDVAVNAAPSVETPAVETPAVETPAVETPAVETPALRRET